MRWVRLVYTEFEVYAADAELLVNLDDSFDYVEGFVFVNSDDPINGWDSVPFSRDEKFDHGKIPPGAGPVLYCLELTVHYNGSKGAAENIPVDKVLQLLVSFNMIIATNSNIYAVVFEIQNNIRNTCD